MLAGNRLDRVARSCSVLFSLAALLGAIAFVGKLPAAEIKGRVVEVSSNVVKIELPKTAGVRVGDAVEIVEFLAEIQDQAHVATGTVSAVRSDSVLVKIGNASARVAVGQQAIFATTSKAAGKSVPVPPTAAAKPAPSQRSAPSSAMRTPETPAGAPTAVGPGELGLTLVRNFDVEPEKLRGTRVYFVYPGGAASKAGLLPDDIILKAGNESWEDSQEAANRVHIFPASRRIDLTYRRDDQIVTTQVTPQPQMSITERILAIKPLAEKEDSRAQTTLGRLYRAGDPGPSNAPTSYQKYFGTRISKNPVQAVAWLRKAAEQNDALACWTLGDMAAEGEGLEKDAAAAFSWFLKGAEQRDALSQFETASNYHDSRGVEKDLKQAIHWAFLSADQGCEHAQYLLGVMYYGGEGTPRDLTKAAACFRAGAEHGLTDAKRALGHCYGKGEGIPKDLSAARRWLLEAGASGDPLAFYDLFHIFYNDGNGTTDREEAFKYLRIAAEKGVAEAQDNMGRAYNNGEMVAQDYAEAVRWFRLAADQNNTDAQFTLGTCYLEGNGVAKDESKALEWIHKAAKQGDSVAQAKLGYMCMQGVGVERDYKTAMAWSLRAAKQGDTDAQNNIALMYQNGWGVEANRVEAIAWWLKSAHQGNEVAKKNLRDLGVNP
jgi:TPR repeat protein